MVCIIGFFSAIPFEMHSFKIEKYLKTIKYASRLYAIYCHMKIIYKNVSFERNWQINHVTNNFTANTAN